MDGEHRLSNVRFRWSPRKAASNFHKHGVGFTTACEVFFDPFVCWIGGKMVGVESREMLLGMTSGWQLLVVVYVDRGEYFRLVSARRATRHERRMYEDQ